MKVINPMLAKHLMTYPLVLAFLCLLGASTAQGDIITMLTGRIGLAPVSLGIENVNAATNVNGVVHVVGQHQGQGARQVVDLATGTVGNVEFFHSIASAQGSNGIRDGKINNVTLLNDGRAIYVGQSYGIGSNEPTFWFDPFEPHHPLIVGQSASGELRDVSANGTFAGTSGFVAAVYGDAATNTLEALPGLNARGAIGITDNAEFIAGEEFIWNQNEFGGYDVYSTLDFDFSSTGDDVPAWVDVEIDPISGDPVFAGVFFDLNSFTDRVGFWREDGSLIGTTDTATFTDFEVIDGHLVAAVHGLDDSYLYAMTDFSSISMT